MTKEELYNEDYESVRNYLSSLTSLITSNSTNSCYITYNDKTIRLSDHGTSYHYDAIIVLKLQKGKSFRYKITFYDENGIKIKKIKLKRKNLINKLKFIITGFCYKGN